ncbi:Uncharacterised protein [Neisseria meningitidis]|nr:Uncharacterised protein [Neisseria meningitidis]
MRIFTFSLMCIKSGVGIYSELNLNQYSVASPSVLLFCLGSPPCPDFC